MTRSIDPADRSVRTSRRDRVVHFRLSASDCVAIEGAAGAAGLTVSAFMRSLVLEGAGVHPFLAEEDKLILGWLHNDLRAVGINLNQIARRLNGGSAAGGELGDLLGDLQGLVGAVALELGRYAARRGRGRKGQA
jgi:hypothetical protein